jgi:hypothetical protein
MHRFVATSRLSLVWIGLAVSIGAYVFPFAALAQTRTLLCSIQPGGPSSYQIDLEYNQSRVRFQGDWHQASFSEQEIRWSTPRFESGTGRVRFAARFVLNRIDGVLRVTNECLSRDSDICNPGYVSYCQPGQKQF